MALNTSDKICQGDREAEEEEKEKSILDVASLSWNFVQLHSLIKKCFL